MDAVQLNSIRDLNAREQNRQPYKKSRNFTEEEEEVGKKHNK